MKKSAALLLASLAYASFSQFALAEATAPSVPAFRHPGGGQVFYFVLTDRFANGNPGNDRGGLEGDRNVTGFDPTDRAWYQGGDFTGLVQKLDYLQGLGITAVWVTPPFKNRPALNNIGGYHGYWILDFLAIDPHLGSDKEFRDFVDAAHARGIKVFLDIICNHTSGVIEYEGDPTYRHIAEFPLKDAQGRPFDERTYAWNGVNKPDFPELTKDSFPLRAYVPKGLESAKNPAWLNDIRYYHNRGETTFKGENSMYGDFMIGGLDDVMTEHPAVIKGFIDIYTYWMREYKIDGFRIDTVKHANPEFWQAFSPALRQAATALGRPGFFHFGEVAGANSRFLGDYASETQMDGTLDFAFYAAAKEYVAKAGKAEAVRTLFDDDDLQIRPQGSAHLQTTFLGNHDDGRFLYFVRTARPDAKPEELLGRAALGNALLFASRGQPVIYYGDEQGMNVIGNDILARETMFASKAPGYKEAFLVGSKRTGADDKFDNTHPLYRLVGGLANLRKAHPALTQGATLAHNCGDEAVLAFSRFERGEKHEYVAVFNNDHAAPREVKVPTVSAAGTTFISLTTGAEWAVNGSGNPAKLVSANDQALSLTLPALGWAIYRAETALPAANKVTNLAVVAGDGKSLTFGVRETDFHRFSDRQPIEAKFSGGDGFGEVTFTATRASRPGQVELLGVDDTAPYRVFWRPPADWAEGDQMTFHASFNDLRGHSVSASSSPLSVAPGSFISGVRGSVTPRILSAAVGPNAPGVGIRTLTVLAEGSGPLEYQWYRDDEVVVGANQPILKLDGSERGRFRVLVSGPGGAVLSDTLSVSP